MHPVTISRRDWLAAAGGAFAALAARPAAALALVAAKPAITIYKSPTCGCCAKWVDHVRAAGFVATVHDTEAMDPVKKRNGGSRNRIRPKAANDTKVESAVCATIAAAAAPKPASAW